MIQLSRLPLFVQTLGLVLATLLIAQVTALTVILNLPPPLPDVYSVEEVVQAVNSLGRAPVETREGRSLISRPSSAPPKGRTVGRRRLLFRNAVARQLGIPPDRVVVNQHGTRIVAVGEQPRAPRDLPEASGAPVPPHPLLIDSFEIGVQQPVGNWLVVQPKEYFGLDPWRQRLLLVLLLSALAVSPLAWAFSRRIAAPIIALAAGAERLGRDPGAPPLTIAGSAEVVGAVIAFNEMQARLQRYVELRTTMLAAIAHDLRSPLTRLRFRIEATPTELHEKLAADIDQMEAMVVATLDFVRDVAKPRDRRKLELASLLETVMDEATLTGAKATVEHAERLVVEGDSLALKRMIVNLVDNALKFGAGARGRLYARGDVAVIEILDDGPGVPEADIERAFEPFHRLEASRSRQTGGIGLGLAMVRAVARGHGGEATLRNLPGGGLCAAVTIPLSPVV